MNSPIQLSCGEEEDKGKEKETLREASQKMKMARKKARAQKNKHDKFPFDSPQTSSGTESSLQPPPSNTTRLSPLSPKSQNQTKNPTPASADPATSLQPNIPVSPEVTTYQISDILARAQNIKLLFSTRNTSSTALLSKTAEVSQPPVISHQQAQARQFLASLQSCTFRDAMS